MNMQEILGNTDSVSVTRILLGKQVCEIAIPEGQQSYAVVRELDDADDGRAHQYILHSQLDHNKVEILTVTRQELVRDRLSGNETSARLRGAEARLSIEKQSGVYGQGAFSSFQLLVGGTQISKLAFS